MGSLKIKKDRGYRRIAALVRDLSEADPKKALLIVKDKRMVASFYTEESPNVPILPEWNLIERATKFPNFAKDLRNSTIYACGDYSKEFMEYLEGYSLIWKNCNG